MEYHLNTTLSIARFIPMIRFFLASGALFSLCGVVTRALSSHALHESLSASGSLNNFNLASDYLLIHGLALICTAILFRLYPANGFMWAGWAFFVGSILFQGTVFAKCFMPLGPIGLATPLGGLFLMAGWLLLALSALLRV